MISLSDSFLSHRPSLTGMPHSEQSNEDESLVISFTALPEMVTSVSPLK